MLAVGFAVVAGACKDEPRSLLKDLDLEENGKATFDANNVADDSEFVDIESLDTDAVQRFFEKTPYGNPSFLETYQSNGVRASAAIVRAGQKYSINPLVLVVFAQTAQGLLGERNYPFPVNRIEYVFRCGCAQQTECDPDFAGFDRQVDCLARDLRAALDQVRDNKATASGWGPGKPMTTLDQVSVTPANAATAALYDRVPRVAEGKGGGSWVFWNIWHVYAPKIDYGGPIGAISGRWIGEACASSAACGIDNGVCATNYPNGLCTVACQGGCPTQPSKPSAYCAKFPEGGFCLQECNPAGGGAGCRKGYTCTQVEGLDPDKPKGFVCSSDPNVDENGNPPQQEAGG